MVSIRNDAPLTQEEFQAVLRRLGFRTGAEAAEALGVTAGYISLLNAGKKQVLPKTPTHKLLQALLREQRLVERLRQLEGKRDGAAE